MHISGKSTSRSSDLQPDTTYSGVHWYTVVIHFFERSPSGFSISMICFSLRPPVFLPIATHFSHPTSDPTSRLLPTNRHVHKLVNSKFLADPRVYPNSISASNPGSIHTRVCASRTTQSTVITNTYISLPPATSIFSLRSLRLRACRVNERRAAVIVLCAIAM